jgi:hypothetical protein
VGDALVGVALDRGGGNGVAPEQRHQLVAGRAGGLDETRDRQVDARNIVKQALAARQTGPAAAGDEILVARP